MPMWCVVVSDVVRMTSYSLCVDRFDTMSPECQLQATDLQLAVKMLFSSGTTVTLLSDSSTGHTCSRM